MPVTEKSGRKAPPTQSQYPAFIVPPKTFPIPFVEQGDLGAVHGGRVTALPYPWSGHSDDGVGVRAESRRLVGVVISTMCLGVLPAAEAPGPEPAGNRSPSRSAEIAAAIRVKLPKYQPKPDEDEVTMKESAEAAVERDGVLNLPTVLVQAKRQPPMTEYEMLTPKGRLELALRRRPGLRIGNLFGMNNGVALALLHEDIEREKRERLTEQVERLSLDDGPETRALKALLKDAVARPNTDWMNGRGR